MVKQYDPEMARWRGVSVAVAVLSLASCSSGGESTPATTSVPPTVPPSTDVSVTTGSSSTTTMVTTTSDPAEALAEEVEADLLEAFRLGREAEQDPFDEEKERAALDRRIGTIAENFRQSLAELRAKNYVIRSNPVTPATVTIEGDPRFFAESEDFAEVQICEINSWILVEVGAGPNGTDAIVNPDVVASRSTIFMRNVDGIWRFEGSSLIEEWDGVAECAVE